MMNILEQLYCHNKILKYMVLLSLIWIHRINFICATETPTIDECEYGAACYT